MSMNKHKIYHRMITVKYIFFIIKEMLYVLLLILAYENYLFQRKFIIDCLFVYKMLILNGHIN